MGLDNVVSIPVQRYTYCSTSLKDNRSSQQLPWIHSPYRDSLFIIFDSRYSDIPRLRLIWQNKDLVCILTWNMSTLSDMYLQENICLDTVLRSKVVVEEKGSLPAFSILARSPLIGVKVISLESEPQNEVRRFQLRFQNEENFKTCLNEFSKYNCIIKHTGFSDSSMIYSQRQLPEQAHYSSNLHNSFSPYPSLALDNLNSAARNGQSPLNSQHQVGLHTTIAHPVPLEDNGYSSNILATTNVGVTSVVQSPYIGAGSPLQNPSKQIAFKVPRNDQFNSLTGSQFRQNSSTETSIKELHNRKSTDINQPIQDLILEKLRNPEFLQLVRKSSRR
ncbi:uncharacterized protein V1516DRAFT_676963 [Lipomyces oligophaga]|uniref:uncharacterized protein n=1 Tax=Lipomyces oligophaga TaxID=45792 RepID=UPI0034CE4565